MCGIVATYGTHHGLSVVLDGLSRLEYRGYDSAGAAVSTGAGRVWLRRSVGRVEALRERCREERPDTRLLPAIGHTRWATHGGPTEDNAHPQVDASGRFAVVHNGVIENADAVRAFLIGEGVTFHSETDTEALVQLVGYEVQRRGLEVWDAFRAALQACEGALAVALIDGSDKRTLYVARRGSPLLIGRGGAGWIVGSDSAVLAGCCDEFAALGEGECARLNGAGLEVSTFASVPVDPRWEPLAVTIEAISLGGHADFMHKEIHEQPVALARTLAGRCRDGRVALEGVRLLHGSREPIRRVLLFGCGTAWHAGMVGSTIIESITRLPTRVEYASELRYRDAVIEPGTLAIGISQSGETADTLEALREMKRSGAMPFGVVNVPGSSIAREAGRGAYLHVGPEIGVASTKAFTGQVMVLAMLAAGLAPESEKSRGLVAALSGVPELIQQALVCEDAISEIAHRYAEAANWLFLGRGINHPVALEGALKLKEISYRHAEGMPAAEIKHGPLALVEDGMPIVLVAPDDQTAVKVHGNAQQVRSRGGRVIAITTLGDGRFDDVADHVIEVPRAHPLLSPLVTVVPLQLLAYHAARCRGVDVDRPRNLAKSVTVE